MKLIDILRAAGIEPTDPKIPAMDMEVAFGCPKLPDIVLTITSAVAGKVECVPTLIRFRRADQGRSS